MTVFPQLLEKPYIFYVFALLVLTLVALAWPEIWGWINPIERVIRRSDAQLKRERDHRVKPMIDRMRKYPWVRSVRVIDYEKGLGRVHSK